MKEMHGECSTHEMRDAYRVLVGKYEGKRPLGRSGRRWEGNNKMGFQKVGHGTLTGLIWLRKRTVGGLL
jgi:hypothetical protein